MDAHGQVGVACSCLTCGYEWPWGQDGSHSCAQTLLGVISDLNASQRRRQIELLEEISRAGESSWDNNAALYEKQRAIDAKLRELRAEEAREHQPTTPTSSASNS